MGSPTLFTIPVLRYMKTYGLTDERLAMASVVQRQWAANWVMGDLFGALKRLGVGIEKSPVSAGQIGALIDLIADGTISGRLAKDVFAEMVASGADPAAIVEAKGLRQVTDEGAIASAIDAVLTANADKVAEHRAGRDKLYGFFVGQVMRATQGKAKPALVNRLLKSKLAG